MTTFWYWCELGTWQRYAATDRSLWARNEWILKTSHATRLISAVAMRGNRFADIVDMTHLSPATNLRVHFHYDHLQSLFIHSHVSSLNPTYLWCFDDLRPED